MNPGTEPHEPNEEELKVLISNQQVAFENAINFTLETDEGLPFLTAWREGDWETIEKEWPEFKIDECLRCYSNEKS